MSSNALSDMDDKGKGENNGNVGSSVDIQTRNEILVKNKYNKNYEYSSTNPDALSDGDEYGKGELDGSVGSVTDINRRIDNVGRNIYGENHRYPDF